MILDCVFFVTERKTCSKRSKALQNRRHVPLHSISNNHRDELEGIKSYNQRRDNIGLQDLKLQPVSTKYPSTDQCGQLTINQYQTWGLILIKKSPFQPIFNQVQLIWFWMTGFCYNVYFVYMNTSFFFLKDIRHSMLYFLTKHVQNQSVKVCFCIDNVANTSYYKIVCSETAVRNIFQAFQRSFISNLHTTLKI